MVVMTTYERPGMLTKTLESLRKTYDGDMVIFDDCSREGEKINELAGTDEEIVVRPHRMGTYVNTRLAIREGFERCNDDAIVYCQDDVRFADNWYELGLECFYDCSQNVYRMGILSLYNFRFPPGPGLGRVLEHGHPGAVCWVVDRQAWEKLEDQYELCKWELEESVEKREKKRGRCHMCDWVICTLLRELGCKIAYTSVSYVQHVGDHSTLCKRNMRFTRSPFFQKKP
jgi:glycosyltransferase involved in cell wall biosynthesis